MEGPTKEEALEQGLGRLGSSQKEKEGTGDDRAQLHVRVLAEVQGHGVLLRCQGA